MSEHTPEPTAAGAPPEPEKFLPLRPEDGLTADLKFNLFAVEAAMGESADLIVRRFQVAGLQDRAAALVYIDGMVNSAIVHDHILMPLMLGARLPLPGARLPGPGRRLARRPGPTFPTGPEVEKPDLRGAVVDFTLLIGEVGEARTLGEVTAAILLGDTVVLFDGADVGVICSTKGFPLRSVQEPETEHVVRGPREGFTEAIRLNTALVRRHVKNPNLRVRQFPLGKATATPVAMLYIEGIADPAVVAEAERRLKRIDANVILESGYVEQWIEDAPWSPFPTIQHTERPDKVAANLLEGRVAILVDGSPMTLLAPAVFVQFLQSPEDYYERFGIATLTRLVRFAALALAALMPALYVAVTNFHLEMIPTTLLLRIAGTREAVPFPAIVEALSMELSLELLREAGVRLPGPIGNTIGIVGALIVGQAAVTAGLVSPIMVIVVAATAIASFAIPSYSAAIPLRLVRFPLMVAAAIGGLYGITLGVVALLAHMGRLRSFGVPYMAPLYPAIAAGQRDALVRGRLWKLEGTPPFIRPRGQTRPPAGTIGGPAPAASADRESDSGQDRGREDLH